MPQEYNTTYCDSPDEFPSWKEPCPKCGNKISHRKDGTGAWCKGCGWNWKISKWQKPTEKKTNGTALIMEELSGVNERLDKLIAFLVKKLEK